MPDPVVHAFIIGALLGASGGVMGTILVYMADEDGEAPNAE